MMNIINKQENTVLFDHIRQLLSEARGLIVRNVNHTMVCTYFEIGRMIVEDEQKGEHRAEYGKQVLKELSERLTAEFGRGYSVDNLERMKRFYLLYIPQISATVLRKLQTNDNQCIAQIYAILVALSQTDAYRRPRRTPFLRN